MMQSISSKHLIVLCSVVIVIVAYIIAAHPIMMDDGFHYEGFTEAVARGSLDFNSFYGFQGLSILSVPIYWVTHSPISIIITSMILCMLSILLAYGIGKLPGVVIFLLMPYPYMTMMRGF